MSLFPPVKTDVNFKAKLQLQTTKIITSITNWVMLSLKIQ